MSHAPLVPGRDVAIYTESSVLTPATYADFVSRVRELLLAGERASALTLWESVVEILHHPARGGQQLLGFPDFPPLRVAPCVDMECARCQGQRGGFRFPWRGEWSRRRSVVREGVDPSAAWAAYHGDRSLLALEEVQALAAGPTRDSIVPPDVQSLVDASLHPLSCLSVAELFIHWGVMLQGYRDWYEPWVLPPPGPHPCGPSVHVCSCHVELVGGPPLQRSLAASLSRMRVSHLAHLTYETSRAVPGVLGCTHL